MYNISFPNKNIDSKVNITGSKSEANRLLILQALSKGGIEIENMSNSNDSELLIEALKSNNEKINVGPAGTTTRFLTAYFASQEGRTVELWGTERLHQRPISDLVDALRLLGADIEYLQTEGCPPLRITGKKLINSETRISASTSSQFITALLLIASTLENGLELILEGELVSIPYIKMTLALLERCGINHSWDENVIKISPQEINSGKMTVESDWSSASYYFSYVALAQEAKISISSYRQDSLQGDSELVELYKNFGIRSTFEEDVLTLEKDKNFVTKEYLELDLENTPDIAQTIAVTMAGLKIKGKLTGLQTLKVKETDRIVALVNELKKCGVETIATNDSLELVSFKDVEKEIIVDTYDDHRMAMAFAPYALIKEINIKEPEVVVKSYPDFWEDAKSIGATIV